SARAESDGCRSRKRAPRHRRRGEGDRRGPREAPRRLARRSRPRHVQAHGSRLDRLAREVRLVRACIRMWSTLSQRPWKRGLPMRSQTLFKLLAMSLLVSGCVMHKETVRPELCAPYDRRLDRELPPGSTREQIEAWLDRNAIPHRYERQGCMKSAMT